jgi:hypothetical protein
MAEMLTFPELANELSLVGFTDLERLNDLFQKVDKDRSGTLNFSEFLSLLYLWHNVAEGNYEAFFRHPVNANVVAQAFSNMESHMFKYDADMSRRLDLQELRAFFRDQWPEATSSGKGVLENVLPLFIRGNDSLSFPGFMLLIYTVACHLPGSALNGKYAPTPQGAAIRPLSGSGPDSTFWRELIAAYEVLEADFRRFDADARCPAPLPPPTFRPLSPCHCPCRSI